MTMFIDGNVNVPGCVCTKRCEMPCWQRIGITSSPCCAACSPLPRVGTRTRDWSQVDAKRAAAFGCRLCGAQRGLEAAHIVGRARDQRVVSPDEIVFLCTWCHRRYDAHEVDLFPDLTDAELRGAVRAAGSPGQALRRLCAPLWRRYDEGAAATLDERLIRLENLTDAQ